MNFGYLWGRTFSRIEIWLFVGVEHFPEMWGRSFSRVGHKMVPRFENEYEYDNWGNDKPLQKAEIERLINDPSIDISKPLWTTVARSYDEMAKA